MAWQYRIIGFPGFDTLTKLPSIGSSDKFIFASLSSQSSKLRKGENVFSKFGSCIITLFFLCACVSMSGPSRVCFIRSKILHMSNYRGVQIVFELERSSSLLTCMVDRVLKHILFSDAIMSSGFLFSSTMKSFACEKL